MTKETLLPDTLANTVKNLILEFNRIPNERKKLLSQLSSFIEEKAGRREQISLNFICTHNSRRSHIAQLWAQVAAHYYSIPGVKTYSGGTEATAFNPRAVKAMKEAGFQIVQASQGNNPVYEVTYSKDTPSVKAFSKKYDDDINPKKEFAAIMTCSHADENCPVVTGAAKRIPITYDDPKDFDGTPQEETKYRERVLQIGREILYAFSQVK
jgi:arsenate reductase (thioredoxin)